MEGKEVGETEISKKLCMFHVCRFLNSTFLMTLLSIWRVSLSQNFYSQLCARRRTGTWRCGTRQRQWIPMGPSTGGFAPIHNFSFLFHSFKFSVFFVCISTYMYVWFCMFLDQKSAVPHAGSLQLSTMLCCVACGSARGLKDLNDKI